MDTTHPQIQSFLGSAIPTFCYEIYRVDGEIHGHKIDWKHWSIAVRDYNHHFDLQGKEARYVLVTEERDITRENAIAFARAVHEQRFTEIRIDLTHVNSTAK